MNDVGGASKKHVILHLAWTFADGLNLAVEGAPCYQVALVRTGVTDGMSFLHQGRRVTKLGNAGDANGL